LPGWCVFDPKTGPQAATVPWQGSGDLAAFARSNCFVVIPEDQATLDAGAPVRILMI
jgi:molybdopterin molybdotransferase